MPPARGGRMEDWYDNGEKKKNNELYTMLWFMLDYVDSNAENSSQSR
ncbi:MAG: hypothetical protein ACI4C1_07050 [Lachnospiraceae bacterium]